MDLIKYATIYAPDPGLLNLCTCTSILKVIRGFASTSLDQLQKSPHIGIYVEIDTEIFSHYIHLLNRAING